MTATVPVLDPQQEGSVKVKGVITGAPGAEYTAVTVQLPPFPFDDGSDQANGLEKGALNTTLPPQELDIVSVPVAGKQPVTRFPDNM